MMIMLLVHKCASFESQIKEPQPRSATTKIRIVFGLFGPDEDRAGGRADRTNDTGRVSRDS